ncbi:MAG: sulfite exporter TauE/SafE family protein [Gemmatimonadaceae bacterium]
MIIIGLGLAALIGLSLGVLGGGGSILTVPIFVYVLGFGAKPAIAMTLPVVGTTSLIGAVSHWRQGNVDLRVALIFGAVAMSGAYLGARLAFLLSGTEQLAILGVVMLGAAVSMMRGRPEGDESLPRRPMPVILGAALAVGMLTGLVGIGGGFLAVPALVLLVRTPMKQAVGTSLLVIAMNSAAGFAGYLGQVEIPWGFLTAFTAMATIGILAGTRLVRHVSQRQLRRGFAVFLLGMAAFVLFQNRAVFTTAGDRPAAANAR